MKMYKVKLYDKEIEIIKDDDGKCIIPKQFKFHTALKPSLEPITVARKPIEEKTVAENVLKYGTGGINIDGCRISINPKIDDPRLGGKGDWASDKMAKNVYEGGYAGNRVSSSPQGRFPANLIHDGSEEVTSLFPKTKGTIRKPTGKGIPDPNTGWNNNSMTDTTVRGHDDSGSASRFFYCAKASKKDRNEGCDDLEEKQYSHDGRSKPIENAFQRNNSIATNNHPTVKPTNLMRYLVRLVTPKQGTVLDPFMGSGSTGKACILEGFDFIGIDLEEEYIKIAEKRINKAKEIKESSFFID